MRTTPIDLQLVRIFAAVAEHTSFSKAAASLHVTKGTVSRSVAQLEGLLGVELLHRSTHHVALSTAGAALYERTREPLAALQKAVSDLPERDAAPSGLLRMAVPLDFGTMALPAILSAFTRRFPAVRFDVTLTGGRVDLLKEGYDLAIRVATGPLKDSSLVVRKLAKNGAGVYAAPSYLARRGKPRQLEDGRHTWVMHPGAVKALNVRAESVPFLVNDFSLACDLIRDGVGVGVLPTFVARQHVRDGLLEELPMPGLAELSGELVLLYASGGHPPKKVTAFRDFLVSALRSGF